MEPFRTFANTKCQEYRVFARVSFLVDSIQIVFSELQLLWYRHSFEQVPAIVDGSYLFSFTSHNLLKVAVPRLQDSSFRCKI